MHIADKRCTSLFVKFEVAVANIGGPATVTLIKIVESTVVDIDDTVLLDVYNVTYSGVEDEVEGTYLNADIFISLS